MLRNWSKIALEIQQRNNEIKNEAHKNLKNYHIKLEEQKILNSIKNKQNILKEQEIEEQNTHQQQLQQINKSNKQHQKTLSKLKSPKKEASHDS